MLLPEISHLRVEADIDGLFDRTLGTGLFNLFVILVWRQAAGRIASLMDPLDLVLVGDISNASLVQTSLALVSGRKFQEVRCEKTHGIR